MGTTWRSFLAVTDISDRTSTRWEGPWYRIVYTVRGSWMMQSIHSVNVKNGPQKECPWWLWDSTVSRGNPPASVHGTTAYPGHPPTFLRRIKGLSGPLSRAGGAWWIWVPPPSVGHKCTKRRDTFNSLLSPICSRKVILESISTPTIAVLSRQSCCRPVQARWWEFSSSSRSRSQLSSRLATVRVPPSICWRFTLTAGVWSVPGQPSEPQCVLTHRRHTRRLLRELYSNHIITGR